MAKILIPSWDDLHNLIKEAKNRLTICTPFYSEEGIERVFDALNDQVSVSFITRLSPSDWLNGLSDPGTMLVLLEILSGSDRTVTLLVHQRLHAKLYVADSSIALLGSANLSGGGFGQNIELMVWLQNDLARKAEDKIVNEVKEKGCSLAIEDLASWVKAHEETIKKLQAGATKEPEDLAKIQEDLDNILGYGRETSSLPLVTLDDLECFALWLKMHPSLAGAQVLFDRHTNADGQNLTGHFRQSFFATTHFLRKHPELVSQLSSALDGIATDEVYQPDRDVLASWLDHIDAYATNKGDGYNYAVLRGILPPSLGGTRLGGGGGSSTLKRMLPLVARYLESSEHE